MIRAIGISLLTAAAVSALAFAQEPNQPAAPPVEDTEQLAVDFDALFNPPEDADAETAPAEVPSAPVELGPAPSQEPEAETVEPVAAIVEEPDSAREGETPDADTGDPSEEGEIEDAEDARVPMRWTQYETTTLRGLDKITGRFTDIDAVVGEIVTFGTLKVEVQTCFQTPPDLPPESAAFIRVNNIQPMETEAGLDPEPLVFSGWMFASSPGLNALEHPVYDVWVIDCAKVEIPEVTPEQ